MLGKELYIGGLHVKKPIIQGGMGVGVSLGNLAGAVAREGGIGIISAAQIGFKDTDFAKNTVECNVKAIHEELRKAREIAPNGVIGFNIMVALRNYELYVKEAVKAGADIIISGAGLPTALPELVADSKVAIAPIVSSERSANVILKFWDTKYNRVPDLVVIEGPKAGGHLGFSREQIDEYADNYENFEEEIKKIISTVKKYGDKYGKKIPVAVAGGISDSTQAKRAFELSADLIQVATRFVTTKECDADEKYKMTYVNAKKDDIVIVKSPVGMPGRAIKNSFMERVMKGERVFSGTCRGCLKKCNPKEIPYCITEALINGAIGNVDEALLFCGADAYKAERIETVKEVIDSLLMIS